MPRYPSSCGFLPPWDSRRRGNYTRPPTQLAEIRHGCRVAGSGWGWFCSNAWDFYIGGSLQNLATEETSSSVAVYQLQAVVNAGYDMRVNLNIGKTRDVLVSYAAKPGRKSTSRRQSSLRSSPLTSVASTAKVAVPTSTVIRGFRLRL